MCELEWVVEGQVITGEEEQFTVDMEELDEDGDQFTSVFTTLTMLPQENKHKQLSATCRFSIFGSLSLSLRWLRCLLNFFLRSVASFAE